MEFRNECSFFSLVELLECLGINRGSLRRLVRNSSISLTNSPTSAMKTKHILIALMNLTSLPDRLLGRLSCINFLNWRISLTLQIWALTGWTWSSALLKKIMTVTHSNNPRIRCLCDFAWNWHNVLHCQRPLLHDLKFDKNSDSNRGASPCRRNTQRCS